MRESQHHLLVQPCAHLLTGKTGEIVRNAAPSLGRIALWHPALTTKLQHQVEILPPAVRIATSHDHSRGLLDLSLVVAGRAQPLLLLRRLHHDKPPGLHVVSARRTKTSFKNLLQVFRRNRRSIKAGTRSSFLDCLTQSLLVFRHRALSHCSLGCRRSPARLSLDFTPIPFLPK